MNKIIFRRIVQGISILMAIAGIGFILFSLYMGYEFILSGDYIYIVFILFIIMISLLYIWVAYQNIWKFSITSIKSFSALVVITVSGQLGQYFVTVSEQAIASERTELLFLAGILPVALMFAGYWIMVKILCKLTLHENNEINDP